MKVLFVSSGNKKSGISIVVENQGKSLERNGIEVEYFPIEGRGFWGYGSNIWKLSGIIRKGKYDVIHAHYSLSGFLATLATLFKGKIVVSLMGTFRKGTLKYYLVRLLSANRWKAVIVKSDRMKSQINIRKAHLVPNGVQVELFDQQPPRDILRKTLNYREDKKYVVFASDPNRPEKNFNLCSEAIKLLNDSKVQLLVLSDLPHEKVAQHMLAADALMLTSFTEGSPNVIKEAMTANCPIVSTDVGDVKHILGETEGCFLLNSFDIEEAAKRLRNALAFDSRTKGRDRILSLGLDDKSIASKIISIYNS